MGHKCVETTLRYAHPAETTFVMLSNSLRRSKLTLEVAPNTQAHPRGKPQLQRKYFEMNGAQERTRTSTTVRPLAPEASASASSATWALSDSSMNCAKESRITILMSGKDISLRAGNSLSEEIVEADKSSQALVTHAAQIGCQPRRGTAILWRAWRCARLCLGHPPRPLPQVRRKIALRRFSRPTERSSRFSPG
jgi:hypothetical protein